MRETLIDIRNKLAEGKYQNEEHVRLSLVCRLLSEIGWDIWNPEEVNTEFSANPKEDKTKVDIALFGDEFSIFIEVKAVGKILDIAKVETQIRDYNRDHTALFSVITDGKSWRLYYSQTGGAFHQKCFKEYDLLDGDLEEIENTFSLFFSKESIENGHAEDEAKKYLLLTNNQKAVQGALLQARRLTYENPFPTLPQAMAIVLTKNKHHNIPESEIIEILKEIEIPEPSPIVVTHSESQHPKQDISLPTNIEHTNLTGTRVVGAIEGKQGKSWSDLVGIAIKHVLQAGYDADDLRACSINVKKGNHIDKGFRIVEDCNYSWQRMNADNAKKALRQMEKKFKFRLELYVT